MYILFEISSLKLARFAAFVFALFFFLNFFFQIGKIFVKLMRVGLKGSFFVLKVAK